MGNAEYMGGTCTPLPRAATWSWAAGCDFSHEACEQAAEGGHLGILQWLRAEGCPWCTGTCIGAVDQGHVEVLRWARENGCEWDAYARDKAAEKLGYTDNLGNLDVHPDDEYDDEFDDEYGYGDQPIAWGEDLGNPFIHPEQVVEFNQLLQQQWPAAAQALQQWIAQGEEVGSESDS